MNFKRNPMCMSCRRSTYTILRGVALSGDGEDITKLSCPDPDISPFINGVTLISMNTLACRNGLTDTWLTFPELRSVSFRHTGIKSIW